MIALNIYKSILVAMVPFFQYGTSLKYNSILYIGGLTVSFVSLTDSSLSLTPEFGVLLSIGSPTPDFDVVPLLSL